MLDGLREIVELSLTVVVTVVTSAVGLAVLGVVVAGVWGLRLLRDHRRAGDGEPAPPTDAPPEA